MASLRDVLNHVGKPVRVVRAGQEVATVLATERSGTALVEPKFPLRAGDELHWPDGRRHRIEHVEPETVAGKIDHYRAKLVPL